VEPAPEFFGSTASSRDTRERIAELERMVGRLTLELQMTKKASQLVTSRFRRNGG
jgi:hypothetical protein